MTEELELRLEHEMESARYIEAAAKVYAAKAALYADLKSNDPAFGLLQKDCERAAQAMLEAAELMQQDVLYRNDELLDEQEAG